MKFFFLALLTHVAAAFPVDETAFCCGRLSVAAVEERPGTTRLRARDLHLLLLLGHGGLLGHRGARQDRVERLLVLVKRQEGDGEGRDPAPHEGHRGPEVVHGLGQHAKGHARGGPDDDEEDAGDPAPLEDPPAQAKAGVSGRMSGRVKWAYEW